MDRDSSVIAQLMDPGVRAELEGGVVTNSPEEFEGFHQLFPGSLPDIQAQVVEIVE